MTTIALAINALIDKDYYVTFMGESLTDYAAGSAAEARLYASINLVSSMFESFCNRNLLARDYTYDELSVNYNQKYSVFTGNGKNTLWLPTYPINSVTKLLIEDVEIDAATDYSDTSGYFIKANLGKIIYENTFPCGYNQNIKISWNGGYAADSLELGELKTLCFEMVKTIFLNMQNNNEHYRREQIGTYSYERFVPTEMSKYKGMNPVVFNALTKYKKVILS